jgi:hypothetical protein
VQSPQCRYKIHIGASELTNQFAGQQSSPWPGIGPARLVARHSSDPSVIETIQTWLTECECGHEACAVKTLSILPSRVVKVSYDQVRLVETSGERAAYAALSHSWGKKALLRTISSSLESHKESILWSALSKTFREAIELTRQLGLDYVWIDSLCIIQDDKLDWEVQASKMASIYENARVVLSATLSKDGEGGFFAERTPPLIIASTPTRRDWHLRQGDAELQRLKGLGPHGEEFNCIVRDSARHAQWDAMNKIAQSSSLRGENPLLERAWAFQERLLATRVVHFADSELVYECRTMQRCECMGLDRYYSADEGSGNFKVSYSQLMLSQDLQGNQCLKGDPCPLWHKIVEMYNECKLTFESDRLSALSGLAHKMQDLGGGTVAAGLLLHDIPRNILWYAVDPGKRPESYVAPSWSWASVQSVSQNPPRIRYKWRERTPPLNLYEWEIEEWCFERRGLEFEPAGVDPAGPLKSASVRLWGPFVAAKLKIVVFKVPELVYGHDGQMMDVRGTYREARYTVKHSRKENSFEADVELHKGPQRLVSGSWVYLLAVQVRRSVGIQR